MRIIEKIRGIRKDLSPYRPLISIFIFRRNIIHNLNRFKSGYPGLEFAPVLKSNAYGHGLKETAEILKNEKKPFLAVDSLFEARQLRHLGFSDNILIIGYAFPEDILDHRFKNFSYSIISLSQLESLSGKSRKKTNIHLKIDTGMRRQGIAESEVEKAVNLIKGNRNLNLEGVFSHLADADSEDGGFTLKQVEKWNGIAGKFKKEFDSIKYFHLSATAGMKYHDKISANMVRLGIGLYGFGRNPNMDLKPALSAKTIITSVRDLKPGDCVGYGATFKAEKNMKVATMPFGYFEGFDRRLSNKGFIKVRDEFCPVVGRVSMNITSFDVSNVPGAKVGDEVTVISDDPEDRNSVSEMAETCGTIPYVILTGIPPHLKRVVSK